ncbi:LPXTG cell wall anchor domain-containing protein [Lactococcus lactis]
MSLVGLIMMIFALLVLFKRHKS